MQSITLEQLSGGLTLYIGKADSVDSSTAMCMSVKSGSAYEVLGERGLSHYLEHLSIYPHLYAEKNNVHSMTYFKAFNYAFTSFYDTAYFFKAVDPTKEMLYNSLITAKGILDGIFLDEEGFSRTRKDVLAEYHDFIRKSWYSACNNMLKAINISMPIGCKEDIRRADLADLQKMHEKHYEQQKTAIIISSPHDIKTVSTMVNEIFERTYVRELRRPIEVREGGECEEPERKDIPEAGLGHPLFYAWFPRRLNTVLETLGSYMELSVLSRAIELAILERKGIDSAECNVELFNHGRYLFKIRLLEKDQTESLPSSTEIFRGVCFSIQLFQNAKNEVIKQLKEQYAIRSDEMNPGEILNCCREHFLFDEPIINLEKEYSICLDFLEKIDYDQTKMEFHSIIQQFL